MAYIGRGTENISNVEVLDNLTFDGSASYTLQKSSTNFVPSSANNLLISISGVVQQGNFSVSGSTITFDTTVSASDTCDWILHYGTGLITTVADGAITEAKLGNNAVTASKIDSSVALGKIGQVVQDTSMAVTSTTSSFPTFVDTGLSVNITLSSTSSKALIIVTEAVGSSANDFIATHLYRDSTAIGNYHQYTPRSATGADLIQHGSYHYLDAPASVSTINYSVKFCNGTSSNTCYHGGRSGASSFCMINVMEVLA